MGNILRDFVVLAATCLATGSVSRAQPTGHNLPTAAKLKKNLAIIEGSTVGESEALDRLEWETAKMLVTYLRTHELSAAAAENLGIDLSVDSRDATHLKVFTYSYSSGGTRGTINRPVFQWKNAAGKRFAYQPDLEDSYGEIYRLAAPGRTRYLLLGGHGGSGRCIVSEARVIEVKGDYLLLDNQAFGTGPDLTLCNVEMTFDTRQQVLRIDYSFYEENLYDRTDEEQGLRQKGYRHQPGATRVVLSFRGGRFVQSP